MQRRIGWAFVLAGLTSVGNWGCATPQTAPQAPMVFRQWAPPGNITAKPATSTPGAAFPAGDTTTVLAPTTSTHWWQNYRPGSLIKRLMPAPTATAAKPSAPAPAVASTGRLSDETLAGYFPTLYGKGNGDAARLARARRPEQIESTTNPDAGVAQLADSPRAGADRGEATTTLAVGVPVQAHPGSSGSTWSEVELTGREETAAPAPAPGNTSGAGRKPYRQPAASVEQPSEPAGANTAPGQAALKPEPADALSTSLQIDNSPARTSAPASQNRAHQQQPDRRRDDAPSDPASHPTSGTVEVSTVAPARETAPPVRSIDDPLLAGRPRMIRAQPIELPPPEPPATYHTESVRLGAREAPHTHHAPTPEPNPRKPLFPRFSRLIWGPDTTPPAPPARTEGSRTAN
jgi:hypothetical protein